MAGGHTVDDPEPKYGMAVVGEVHPDRMLTNAGLQAGQALVLTKPLGIGIITTAQKRDVVDPAIMQAAIASMTMTNAAPPRQPSPPVRPVPPTSPVSACSVTAGGWPRSPVSVSRSWSTTFL